MVAPVQQVFRYRVDDNDVIEFVDQWWLAFARENSAFGLDEPSVVGHAIWDFIADEPTRTLYAEIHQHVRSTGKPVVVPFRCDSPTLRRYMEPTISGGNNGQLLYQSALVRTCPHRRQPVYDRTRQRSSESLTMCSMCKRSLIEPAGWLEMEDISLRLRMYDQQTVPELCYTVCPQCSSRFGQDAGS